MSTRVGELLVKTGIITPDQLERAVESQQSGGGFLGSHLVKLGFVSEQDLTEALSNHYGVNIVELDSYTIDESALQLIPHNLALKHNLLPLSKKDTSLTVVMADPSNIVALNDIKFITGLDIQVFVAPETAI